jgi:hypothetical protein
VAPSRANQAANGGKTVVAGAIESGRGKMRGRRLGRLRLAALPDASRANLEGFLAANVTRRAGVTTDGWAAGPGTAARTPSRAVHRLHRVVGRMPGRWHSGTSGGSVDTRSNAHLQVAKMRAPTVSEVSIRLSRMIASAL